MTGPKQSDPDDVLLAAVAAIGDEAFAGELSDDAIVRGALAGLDAGIPGVLEEPATPAVARTVGVVAVATVVAVLAIAAAALLFIVQPELMLGLGEQTTRSLSESVADGTAEAQATVERELGAKHTRSGPQSAIPSSAPDAEPAVKPEATPELEPNAEPELEPAPEPEPEPEPEPLRNPTQRPSVSRTADELLRRAQGQLADGDRPAALATYDRLVSRFPQSKEARAAHVSMGRIELARGRASQALQRFDDYLAAPGGALREEARYGRIRALRDLKREKQEHASIASFLSDHPQSVYASRLKRRLSELELEPQ